MERSLSINGVTVPRFIYGTAWKEQDTERCVRDALHTGFRAVDTANQRKHYFEAGTGAAVRACMAAGLVTRSELFLQTKFTYQRGQDHRLPYDPKASFTDQVQQSFALSLEHLHTDYLDSYVLHGPAQHPGLAAADHEVWAAMEALQRAGSVRLLGVSNVDADQLQRLCETAAIKPSFVQNRCYASRGWDAAVRSVCAEHGVRYQGFSLLTANREVWNGAAVAAIARQHGCTPAQVLFAFALSLDMLPLTGTTDPAHMAKDLEAFGVQLTPDDIAKLR